MAEATAGRAPGSTRTRVQAGLDRLVAANRLTIAVVVPLVGAALLLASAADRLPAALAFNPVLLLAGAAVMRLPLVAGLGPLVDRRAGLALAALAAYTYAVEFVGVTTGLPYGEFSYGVALGPMAAGVPLALPLFFVPLVLDGYLLADRLLGSGPVPWWQRVPLAVGVVLAIDLVLDPAAVALGFWEYGGPGVVGGVPLSNFRGWLLSAAVAVVLLEVGFDVPALRARARTCPYLLDDLVSFVLLWGVVVAATAAWLSVAVALLVGLALVRTGSFPVDPLAHLPGPGGGR